MQELRWRLKSGILFVAAALICFVGAAPAGAQDLACNSNQGPNCVCRAGAQTLTAAAVAGAVRPDTTPNPSGNPEPLGGAWTETQVFNGFMLGITFGNGRNDDVVRLYSTQITANTVKEFTYDGSWSNTSNINLPFYSERSVEVGAGQNDDVMRVYVGEFNGAGNAREFTWDGSAWTSAAMGTVGQQLINVAFGDARNDGVNRVYFSTGSSPPNNAAREFSYTGTAWTEAPIPAPGGDFIGGWGIALGDGRNDGTPRVYQGSYPSNSVYEHTWNGTGWSSVQIGGSVGSQIMGVAVGDGRNDGTNRVYVVARDVGIREYTFDGTAWSLTATIPVGTETFDVAIGQGQNDGVNHLYAIRLNPGTLVEASFDGTAWNVTPIGTPGGLLFHMRVGDARGDTLNRIYVGASSGLFEYEWQ